MAIQRPAGREANIFLFLNFHILLKLGASVSQLADDGTVAKSFMNILHLAEGEK